MFVMLHTHTHTHTLDDHSRVIMEEMDEPGSDYINANFIDVSTLLPMGITHSNSHVPPANPMNP